MNSDEEAQEMLNQNVEEKIEFGGTMVRVEEAPHLKMTGTNFNSSQNSGIDHVRHVGDAALELARNLTSLSDAEQPNCEAFMQSHGAD
jgi:hypothetical protein